MTRLGRHAGWFAIAALALSVPAGRAVAGLEGQSGLNDEELRKLGDGELVERRVTREQAGMRLMGGTSWQVIDAPPEVVWQALRDTPYYPRMLPQLIEARLVNADGMSRKLFMRHGSGLAQTSYYLDVHFNLPRHEISFRVDDSRPSGIRAAWGFYSVRPYGHGRTLLVFGVMADIGDGIATALLRGTVHEWMMKVPFMVKRFVEGSGRHLYAPGTGDGLLPTARP
jgi:hypothetical protein